MFARLPSLECRVGLQPTDQKSRVKRWAEAYPTFSTFSYSGRHTGLPLRPFFKFSTAQVRIAYASINEYGQPYVFATYKK